MVDVGAGSASAKDGLVQALGAALVLILVLGAAATAHAAPREDPMLNDQWALDTAGTLGAHEAWTQSRGAGVVVALLDTGVQLDHPDLAAALWTNPGEIPGNGADDDGNGFADDVHGADLINGDGAPDDDEGHGTHVAGILAAAQGNGIGVSGLAPGARIMPVKVLDAARGGSAAALAGGIRYAVAEGARILNVPLNGDVSTPDIYAAVAEARAAGATVVASAGNDGRDVDATPSYPASLPLDNVVSVTAVDGADRLWSSANRGRRTVDVAAPGVDVLATSRGSDYADRTGTSMAATYVSGALALLSAARPDLGQRELRAALLATTARPGSLRGRVRTGTVDVAAAMRRLRPGRRWQGARVTLRTPRRVRAGRVTLRWSATGVPRPVQWQVSLDGRTIARVAAGRPLRVSTRVQPGAHRWHVVAVTARSAAVQAARRGSLHAVR